MPVDYYPQKSAQDLLVILEALQQRATTGVVHFTTAAGMQQQKTFIGARNTEIEIRRVLYSLHLRGQMAVDNAEAETNPYPNPYHARIRRTRARYTFS